MLFSKELLQKTSRGTKKVPQLIQNPKSFFLFLSFFFFSFFTSPTFLSSACNSFTKLEPCFSFPTLSHQQNKPSSSSTTHHRMHSDPITHENISTLKPGLTRCLESLIETPPRPSQPHSLLEHIQKTNIYPARPHERDSDPIARSDHRGLTRTLIGSIREPER